MISNVKIGKLRKKGEIMLTPIRAIRANCVECSGGSKNEVKLCAIPSCPLYPYRLGKHPKLAGRGGRGNPKWVKGMKCGKGAEKQ